MITEALSLKLIAGPAVLCAVAVLALVVSDLKGLRAGRYLFKPLAASAFIWVALSLDATTTAYGSWMLAALALCMLGDVFLMFDTERSFLAGLGAFLCGHLLFAVAFCQLPTNFMGLAASALPAMLLLAGLRRWLAPHVPPAMKIPVALYVAVITLMLLCAGLTVDHPAAVFIIGGAWGFAISDLAVARRQFINPSRINGLWGTPLYFGSQMVLACSIAFA